jgi:hypothetical protein
LAAARADAILEDHAIVAEIPGAASAPFDAAHGRAAADQNSPNAVATQHHIEIGATKPSGTASEMPDPLLAASIRRQSPGLSGLRNMQRDSC